MTKRPVIRVELAGSGAWLVSLPDEDRAIVCETLDEARRAALLSAIRRRACELIVHDAYHRVLEHDLIPPPGRSTRVPQSARRAP